MGLQQYRHKRDFQKTPEPRGKRGDRRSGELTFVIQKHDASHLHYDFRLELNGVLKSWAVPKGPDLDPANKRLAMQVEDHPLEYGGFEGTIPEGEYGGGTVMLWDQGVWEPIGDAEKGLREGHLKFILHGEKLQGGWMLVRKGGRNAEPDERAWFLFKERDEFARPGESITEDYAAQRHDRPGSGRDRRGIGPRLGTGGRGPKETPQNGQQAAQPPASMRARKPVSGGVATARRRAAKATVKPKVTETRNGERDSHFKSCCEHPEVRRAGLPKRKPSSWRRSSTRRRPATTGCTKSSSTAIACYAASPAARRASSAATATTGRQSFPSSQTPRAGLAVSQAMLDGEVVSLKPDGTTSFQALQNVFQTGRTSELVYYVFDILHLDGHDVTGLPLEVRRELAQTGGLRKPRRRYASAIPSKGRGRRSSTRPATCIWRASSPNAAARRTGPDAGSTGSRSSARSVRNSSSAASPSPAAAAPISARCCSATTITARKLIYAGRVGTGFNEKTLEPCTGSWPSSCKPDHRIPISRARPATRATSPGSSRCLLPRSSSRTGPTRGCFGIRPSRGCARTSPPARSFMTSPFRSAR